MKISRDSRFSSHPSAPSTWSEAGGRGRCPSGFTLIELLVVIAIIALLASLMVSFTSKAKGSALKTACQSNLRQCGLAVTAYATDHKGTFPRSVTISGVSTYPETYNQDFRQKMKPYVGDFKVWRCPAVGGAVPLDHEDLSNGGVRGTYQYFAYIVSPGNAMGMGTENLLMQDLAYTWSGDWRSNHTDGGELRRDAIPGNPAFQTYFGGTPRGFNSLYGDGSVQWTLWSAGGQGETWEFLLTAGSGARVASTFRAYEEFNNSDL